MPESRITPDAWLHGLLAGRDVVGIQFWIYLKQWTAERSALYECIDF